MIADTIKQHREKLRKLLVNALLKDIQTGYKRLNTFIIEYEKACAELVEIIRKEKKTGHSTGLLVKHIEHRKQVLGTLDAWITKKENPTLPEVFAGFDSSMQQVIEETQPHWITAQQEERFRPQPGDDRIRKIIKTLKYGAYQLHLVFFKTVRRIRKNASGAAESLPVWHQKIPARKLTLWYYENSLIKHFIPFADEANKQLAQLAFEVWQLDDALFKQSLQLLHHQSNKTDFLTHYEASFSPAVSNIKHSIEEMRKALRPSLMKLIDETDQHFEHRCLIAGTIESPGFLNADVIRKQVRAKLRKRHTMLVGRRANTLFALTDDWKFNQEIYILTGNADNFRQLFHSSVRKRADLVRKELHRIYAFLQKTQIDIKGEDAGALREQLEHLKYIAGKNLYNTIIPEVRQAMMEQGFPELINATENDLVSVLSSKNRKRILIKDFNPGRAYRDRALEAISLMQLIEFDIAGELRRLIAGSKKQSRDELEKLEGRFQDIGRMVLFNLESAILMPQKQKDASAEETAEQAKAGIQRSIDRYSDLLGAFNSFIDKMQSDFDTAIAKFNNALLELTDNARVDKIRYRIIKAKALKNRERFFRIVSTRSKASLRKGHNYFRTFRKGTITNLQQIRSSLGIHQLSKEISLEVTDFLAKDQDKLKKLPFVYRRLFVNEPLKDAAFYHPRLEEKSSLLKAYRKWQDGSFMAALIYGEKGSGISTFVYMFFEEALEQKPKIYQLLLNQRIMTEEDLFTMLGNSIRGEAFSSFEAFEAFIQENSPFVLFLDKLHLMYMRQPGGFQLLKRLFEIISSTSRQVFWICSCGFYAAQLLDKSIGLFGYFPQLIRIKSLETEKVRNIIMLRHNASGYKLHFSASEADFATRGFSKKTEQQQQELLKEKFFERINRMAQSNISFALQLWLHSTNRVEENVVYLDSLDSLDLSFVHNLPDEVIFGLHTLVLHEILDERQLAQIMHISPRQAYMMLMRLKDRGIVVQHNGMFSIHPLLYRESLALLQNKNLVY